MGTSNKAPVPTQQPSASAPTAAPTNAPAPSSAPAQASAPTSAKVAAPVPVKGAGAGPAGSGVPSGTGASTSGSASASSSSAAGSSSGTALVSTAIARRAAGESEVAAQQAKTVNSPKFSIPSMVVYGLIMMVPVAPFAIYGNVFDASNGMPALSYLVGMCVMLFTVLSFGVMIRKWPSSGSIFTYCSKGMSTAIGFIAGWLMLLQYLLSPDLMYMMGGQALNQYLPAIPVWAWCVFFLAFVTVVSLRGVKTAVFVDRIALAAQVIVIGLFIVMGVIYIVGHPDTASFAPTALFNPEKFNFDDQMSSISLCVLSYVGFGSIATLTQQAKNEQTGPSKAMMATMLILGGMFFAMCYIATCVDPTGEVFRHNSNNGFYLVADLVGGEWLGILCAITNAAALGLFSGLGCQTAIARVMYVMGTTGALPKFFDQLDVKRDVPIHSTLFVSGLSLAILFILLGIGVDTSAKISNFGALSTYFLLNVCVVWYYVFRLKEKGQYWRHLIAPTIGALLILAIIFSLSTVAQVVGLIWIVIGAVYYVLGTRVFHKDMRMG